MKRVGVLILLKDSVRVKLQLYLQVILQIYVKGSTLQETLKFR